jgi:transcriptional regulator with XRE-family HTH domain
MAEWRNDLAGKRIVSVGECFAERLREVRAHKRWTQDDLARCLDALGFTLDRVAISKIEKGKRSVKLEEAMAIAYALDISPNHLFTTYDEGARVRIVPGRPDRPVRPFVPGVVRRWIGGYWTLPEQDNVFFERERPPEELLRKEIEREWQQQEEQQ